MGVGSGGQVRSDVKFKKRKKNVGIGGREGEFREDLNREVGFL